MNTDNENIDDQNDDTGPAGTPTDRRPLGFWLRTVDGLLTREFAAAFENEGVTRRDWMLLNLLSGEMDAPGFAERLARKGKRLRRLEDLGWAEEQGDGTWALTDAGREARERLGKVVDGIRSRVADAVSDEDFATTMASLEAIARELGWDESTPFTRERGFGRGWGRRFGGPRDFGPDAGFGHGGPWGRHGDEGCGGHRGHGHHDRFDHDGHGHAHGDHGHKGHGHGGHRHHGQFEHDGHGHEGHYSDGHRAHRGSRAFGPGFGPGHAPTHDPESAYERGFTAGFSAARVPRDADPSAA